MPSACTSGQTGVQINKFNDAALPDKTNGPKVS